MTFLLTGVEPPVLARLGALCPDVVLEATRGRVQLHARGYDRAREVAELARALGQPGAAVWPPGCGAPESAETD